jgi:ribose transport system ATP-binding protein
VAIASGIGFLSEDRKGEGLAMRQSVRDNALLTLRAFTSLVAHAFAGPLSARRVDALLRAADVRPAVYGGPVELLSGGNQQKTIIARWLTRAPRLLLFAEPTRGIDVAAKAGVYRAMRDYVAGRRAILMASSDLPEVVGVADRIVVMRAGRIAGELPAGASEQQVMALAVGAATEETLLAPA